MHQYAWNIAAGFCNQISGIMPNWFWMVHCGWSCIRFSIRTGIILLNWFEGCNTISFGRIQCAAEFWNQISGKLVNWFWRVQCARLTRWRHFSLRLISSCRIDLRDKTFFGKICCFKLANWFWRVRRVDEVVTVSGISNYWRLEATPYQPPANSHLTRII